MNFLASSTVLSPTMVKPKSKKKKEANTYKENEKTDSKPDWKLSLDDGE